MWIWRIHDAVVHPFPVSPRANDACSPKVSQMPRYFRLIFSQYFNEETNTHFIISHKVEQAEARFVSERAQQLVHVKLHSFFCHAVDSSS